MEFRKNKMLEKLRRGEMVSCVKINMMDSIPVEIAAMCGFDCVWVDMEHTPSDYAVVSKQVLAAKAYGAEIIVRTPRGEYSNYIRPLELDASGIMVPHIMSLEDAKMVARRTKFYPVGLRPIDGGNADGGYCLVDGEAYIRGSNSERLTIIQIEDVEPLAELDEIAAVDGIDMLFFGPGDFSQSLGTPFDFSNPKIEEARIAVAEAALRHGKLAGTVGGIGNMRHLYNLGYRFVSIGADVVALGAYYSNIVSAFNKEFRE